MTEEVKKTKAELVDSASFSSAIFPPDYEL